MAAFQDGPAISAPATDCFAITKSDTVNFTNYCRGIYVGGAGDVVVVTPAGNAITFVGVLAGSVLPVQAKRVNSTSTTATSMVGLL
jgi:hypothetical protein